MFFRNKEKGFSLRIQVIDYQFSEDSNNFFDSNWLNIQIDLNIAGNKWRATDACLTTEELGDLYSWFSNIELEDFEEKSLYFIEPTISFKASKEPQKLLLSIYLDSAILKKQDEGL